MIAFVIVGFIALFLIVVFISAYNNLSRYRVLAEEGWSGIGVFLQQRLDMIPNLVEIVKGYAGHENKTLTDVIKARNESIAALTPEAQVEAAKNMGAAMINFKSLAEGYPELKANENFLRLQEQMAAMEEQLNQARRYYNGTVRDYNQAIAVFPSNVIANIFHFQVKPFFAEEEAATKAPKVQF